MPRDALTQSRTLILGCFYRRAEVAAICRDPPPSLRRLVKIGGRPDGYLGQARLAQAYLHFMKWPLALRHILGLAGHLTNLPFLSLHGAAITGAEAPAIRLNADNA